MTANETRQPGFSLVETLVASIILSSAVLTLGAIGTNALSDTRLNRHREVAARLLDRQLHMIDYAGIDEFIEMGQTEGVIEEFEPGYRWEVTTEYQETDNLYLVTITMTWLEGRRPHDLTVQTMLNGATLAAETDAETTAEQSR
jgi:type II secretory pathway pseudopilin PulG